MKTLINYFTVCFLSLLSFNVSSQVTYTTASAPGICDATATFDLTAFSSSYVWLTQTGDTLAVNTPVLTGLCDNSTYMISYEEQGIMFLYTFLIDPCTNLALNEVVTSNPSDPSVCDGVAVLNPSGGQAPYTFYWTAGATSNPTLNDVCFGLNFVSISDANGCSSLQSFIAYGDSSGTLMAYVSPWDEFTVGSCDGFVDLNTFGGVAPYTYLHSNGATNQIASNLCAGQYTVIITDAVGNTITLPYTIGSAGPANPCASLVVNVDMTTNPTSQTSCDGAAVVNATGGSAPYTYNWNSNNSQSPTLNDVCFGFNNVIVTDNDGCVVNSTFLTYVDSSSTLIGFVDVFDEFSAGSCDGSAFVNVFGGSGPYTYSHSNGATDMINFSLCAGLYNVTVTDALGDSITLPYMVASYVYNNGPLNPGTIILDTLAGGIYQNCTIDFGTVDSMSILNYLPVGTDSILINWAVYDSTGVTNFSTVLFNPGVGSFMIDLAIYCPFKSVGSYIRFFDMLTISEGNLNTTEIEQLNASVYPNPFNNQLTIKLNEESNYSVSVIDMVGRIVLNDRFENTSIINLSNLSDFQSGEYILTITNDISTFKSKIVKY